jgi:hypothetical protein
MTILLKKLAFIFILYYNNCRKQEMVLAQKIIFSDPGNGLKGAPHEKDD